jgi:hypothetical protein
MFVQQVLPADGYWREPYLPRYLATSPPSTLTTSYHALLPNPLTTGTACIVPLTLAVMMSYQYTLSIHTINKHQYTYLTIWEPWEMLQSIQEPISDCRPSLSLLASHAPKSFAYAAPLKMGYRLRLLTPIES